MSAKPSDRPSRFRLVATIDDCLRSFPLWRGENVLGTLSECNPRLEIPGISRRHAKIHAAESKVSITDLGSKNGTIINGRRVEETPLELDDEIELCGVIFTLERLDVADSALAFSLTGPSHSLGEWGSKTTQARLDSGHHEIAAPAALSIARRMWRHLFSTPEPDFAAAIGELTTTAAAQAGVIMESRWVSPECAGPEGAGAEGAGAEGAGAEGAGAEGAGAERDDPEKGDPDRTSNLLIASHGALDRSRLGALEEVLGPNAVSNADQDSTLAGWTFRHGQGDPRHSLGDQAESIIVALDGGRISSAIDALADLLVDWIRHLRHESKPPTLPQDMAPQRLRFPPGFIRGNSPAIQSVYAQLRHLTQGDVPVLIIGDTGVGKEVMARTLHLSSQRADAPMVAINCAAIPAELLESELFGIGRGVATGVSARPGRIAEADGGTLFLDEIGDMPANLQAKLLRVLQEQVVQPLGGRPTAVDVRIISATHSELATSIENGDFRQDLYYRLAGYVLRLPTLAERLEDLPEMVEHFLRRFSNEIGKSLQGMTVAALQALSAYHWPGNIRQLEHEVRRMAYLAYPGQAIDTTLLSPEIFEASATPTGATTPVKNRSVTPESAATKHPVPASSNLPTLDLKALERIAIEAALATSDGTLIDAATRLGLTRDSLRRRLIRHGLRAE